MRHTIEVHDLIQAQTATEVQISAGAVIEKIQLADRVSQAEKVQIFEWFSERFEDLSEHIGTAQQVAEMVSIGLRGVGWVASCRADEASSSAGRWPQ